LLSPPIVQASKVFVKITKKYRQPCRVAESVRCHIDKNSGADISPTLNRGAWFHVGFGKFYFA
jgi:hypothetical protein